MTSFDDVEIIAGKPVYKGIRMFFVMHDNTKKYLEWTRLSFIVIPLVEFMFFQCSVGNLFNYTSYNFELNTIDPDNDAGFVQVFENLAKSINLEVVILRAWKYLKMNIIRTGSLKSRLNFRVPQYFNFGLSNSVPQSLWQAKCKVDECWNNTTHKV